MLEGIKEKMLELLYDIEEEVGKESKLYVHAYDVYVDLELHIKHNRHPFEGYKLEAPKDLSGYGATYGNDLSDEIFKEEEPEPMTKETYALLYCIDKWGSDEEQRYANYLLGMKGANNGM